MSRLIGIQAGHLNIQNNSDPLLRPETGAPGEMQFNVKVRDALGQILVSKGFQVQLDDANTNSDQNTTDKDFAFYLAIHAEFAPPGGEAAEPDPSVDAANHESKRIVAAIESVYFADTGIADVEKIDNGNMDFYYMWRALSPKTPCGIIECGDLNDPHDSVILADIQRVAKGIAHGICNAFNMPWGTPQSPSTDRALLLHIKDELKNIT